MIPSPQKTTSLLALAAAGLAFGMFKPCRAAAVDFTFSGVGNWYDPTGADPNWSPNPNGAAAFNNNFFNTAGNNPVVVGTANYNAGGDFLLGQGNTMTVDGGSWTQEASIGAWVKIGAGGASATLNVTNNGTFRILSTGALFRVGVDGGPATVNVESTAGGLTVGGGTTLVGAGSALNIRGGINSVAEISNANTVAFSGGTTTAGNFTGAGVFNVSGGSTTAATYDMATGSLNVSGGSLALTNLTSNRALTITGGAVTVSNTLNTNATSNIKLSGGSLTKNGAGTVNLNATGTFLLSGNGAFNMTGNGEFQPGATTAAGAPSTQSISGNATLNVAGLVAFQGGATQKFDVHGGALTLGASGFDGIFSNGGYFNFTANSTGSILFPNAGLGENNIFEGSIRFNDTAYTAQDFDSVFNVTHPTATSTMITLDMVAVPEPGTVAAGLLALGALGLSQRRRVRRWSGLRGGGNDPTATAA